MAKEVKKKRTRKKVTKKTKEKKKKISKKKVKVLGKEIKLKIKVPEQTKKIHEISEPLTQLEGFLSEVKAPVLERVVTTEQTPITPRIRQVRDRETGDNTKQEKSEYASTSSDYTAITSPNQETGNNFQYTGTTNDFRNSQNDKEHRETRALFKKSDYSVGGNQNSFERTINPEIEDSNETRKYFSKGDKK